MEQCFFVREVKRGRGVADLSRDKTEVSRGHRPTHTKRNQVEQQM